jgi:hypothetical protein
VASKYVNVWSYLASIGDALVASGTFNWFYRGLPQEVPQIQKRILILNPVDEGEEDPRKCEFNLGPQQWTGRYEFIIGCANPTSNEDKIVGTALDPGITVLVNELKKNLLINLRTYSEINDFSFGQVDYQRFEKHPQRVARMSVEVEGLLNPFDRQSSSSSVVVVESLQAQSLAGLSDVEDSLSPSEGDILKYVSGIWNAATHNLDGLSDVAITAAASGDLLRYNGTGWVDYPDSNYAALATGEAPWNIPLMSSDPVSVASGDFWMWNDSGTWRLSFSNGITTKRVNLT